MLTIRRSFALLALAAMLGGIGLASSFAAPLPTPEPEKKDPAE
jgi:hypothetical protein